MIEIITLASPKAEILRRRAIRVDKLDNELVGIMVETMLNAHGVGLAAPQIGVSSRLIVAADGPAIHVLANPVIVFSKTLGDVAEESCLSMPGVVALVARAPAVTVKAEFWAVRLPDQKNELSAIHGRQIIVDAEGLFARVLQHEIDHLDGILFVDKAVPGTVRKAEATAAL